MIHGTGADRTTAFPHWKVPILDDSAQATSRANAGGAIRVAPITHAGLATLHLEPLDVAIVSTIRQSFLAGPARVLAAFRGLGAGRVD